MSYYQDGGGGNHYSQNSGMKGLERYDITLRVINCVDSMGDLYTALRFGGINSGSNGVYMTFISEFFKLFHITASLLNESAITLVADIETSFAGDIDISPQTAGKFLTHFEDYLHALKEAGVYDPTVFRQMYHPGNAWERSI